MVEQRRHGLDEPHGVRQFRVALERGRLTHRGLLARASVETGEYAYFQGWLFALRIESICRLFPVRAVNVLLWKG